MAINDISFNQKCTNFFTMKTYVHFYKKLRTFLHFLVKNTDFFYSVNFTYIFTLFSEKLRTFLVINTDFFTLL